MALEAVAAPFGVGDSSPCRPGVRGCGRSTPAGSSAPPPWSSRSASPSTNWQAADRSGDRGGDAFVDTVLEALPPDAAILSEWDASTPLWHARYVLGRRPDVLSSMTPTSSTTGWGTRERRIASLICERPVFILRLRDTDLEPTRAAYRVEPFVTVAVAEGGPSATAMRQVFRVDPLEPSACDASG